MLNKLPGTIGPFSVVDEISEGGMAHILLVLRRNKQFAMKVSLVSGRVEDQRFNNQAIRKEADLLKGIDNQRIVKIYPIPTERSMGTDGVYYARANEMKPASWYFVMEHLQGGTLKEHIERYGPLTFPEATNIVGNLTLALCELHRHDFVHKDVSPRNVVFRSRVVKGHPFDPVLIDFGAAVGAKRFRDEAGTWNIMSPERVRIAKGIDPPEAQANIIPEKVDVWSLGVILYYCLTNHWPFDRSSKKLTSQILNHQPESIREYNEHVPSELDDFIIQRCLNKVPTRRISVEDIGRFLKKYGGGRVKAVNAPI